MELTVRELRLEEVVISASDLCNSLGQLRALLFAEIDQRSLVLLACQKDLERPYAPVRYTSPKTLILENSTDLLLRLQRSVITE